MSDKTIVDFLLISFVASFPMLLFAIAFFFRMLACRGAVQSFDSYGHLYYVSVLKTQNQGPFGSITIKVVEGVAYSTPFLWHWILGFFPIKLVVKHQKFWIPVVDSIFAVIIFIVAKRIGFSNELAILTFALYIFTPMWFSRLAICPRIQSFTPRHSGEIATNLFFVMTCLSLGMPIWLSAVLGVCFAFYVLSSSKFGVQALLFLTPLVSIFSLSVIPLVSLLVALTLLAVASKGAFVNSIKQQFGHLRWYFLKNLKGGMAVSNRNRLDGLYLRRVDEGLLHYLARVLIMLIVRNSYTGVLLKMPIIVFVVFAWVLVPVSIIPSAYLAPVWASLIVYCLINLPPLLFLGEAERYLNHVAAFIILASVQVSLQLDLTAVLWVLVAYGALYLLAEAFVLPRLTKNTGVTEIDSQKVIDFLRDQVSTAVLAYPYHAGGGVYRIMSETSHKTVFPFAITEDFLKKIETKFSAKYPYIDITKLDAMHRELGVSVLVVLKAAVDENLGPNWAPSSEWHEVDLNLKLQKVFVHDQQVRC